MKRLNTLVSASPFSKGATALICGYETVAIVVGLPTVSMLCWKHPRLAVVILGTLATHLLVVPIGV